MPAEKNAILAVVDTPGARQTLRNICAAHEETIVERFGRAALLEPTELGAFLAFRLQTKHDGVRVYRTEPIDERRGAFLRAYDAAVAFEERSHKYTPYPKFAAGTDHPLPEEMHDRRLTGTESTD